MKKRFLVLSALVTISVIVLLSACSTPADDSNDDTTINPTTNNTFVVFDNTKGICTTTVYSDYRRRAQDRIAEIPAGTLSGEIEWNPGASVSFFFLYSIRLKGLDGFALDFIPSVGKDQTQVRIDSDTTTRIPIPLLDETLSSPEQLLSSNSYLLIQNSSSSSFKLYRGTTSEIPPDGSLPSAVVNVGEMARYTVMPGSSSDYRLVVGADYKAFTGSVSSFEAGHVYSFVFDGNISLVSEIEIKLENIVVPSINVPDNVRISAITDTSINLEWNTVDRASGYNVYRSGSENGIYNKINSNIITGTTFIDTRLNSFTTYYYKISAVSGSNESLRSNPISGTTLISIPGNVRVTALTDTSVSFEWNPISGSNGYNVYRSNSANGTYTILNTVVVIGTTFTDNSVTSYTSYWYRVSVFINGNESTLSNPVLCTTLLSAPENVRISDVTNNSIRLAWNALSGAYGYNVYRSIDENGIYEKVNNGVVTGTIFTDNSVTPYTFLYYYKVCAVPSGGIDGVQSSHVISANLVPDGGLAVKLTWLRNNATSNSLYLIEVETDETIDKQTLSYNGKSGIGIILRGKGIIRTVKVVSGSLFTVESGVTLILENNIIIKSYYDEGNTSLMYINTGGTLIMNNGVKIIGNNSSYINGGGVYVGSGTFTMNGGEISGNKTYIGDGGGVYVGSGTFTMNDGKISDNSASYTNHSSYGGGVYVESGTFTMNGGEISGNTNSAYSTNSSCGGGVYLHNGTFTMNGGKISSNNSSSTGGGVHMNDGTFTMNGGEIFGNTSTALGGGVNMYNGTFTMSGGVVYGNNAATGLKNTASSGAALYKSSGSSTAQYGILNGNTFSKTGDLTTTNTTIRVVNGNLLTE